MRDMFTGIVEEVGRIREIGRREKDALISVSCRRILDGLVIGDSVAVNGVCLTVTALGEGHFSADVSGESLARTTLGTAGRGREVNLERALTPSSRLGGHIVQGHVDGVGEVEGVRQAGAGRDYSFSCPAEIRSYLVLKGSVAVDGISLTVSALTEDGFSVAAIPHTVEETNLRALKPGDKVNLEVDIIAKYVRSYLERGLPGEIREEREHSLMEKLAEGGFV